MTALLNSMVLCVPQTFPPSLGVGSTTGIFIQAAGNGMAWKFYASTTSPVEAVDLNLNLVGTVTSQQFRIEIQGSTGSYASAADVPNGSVLGAATPNFAGPAAAGFIGLQTLATPTPDLVVGDPYWIVMYNVSGTPDASNYVQSRTSTATAINRARCRGYNGTNWTTITTQVLEGSIIRKHADGKYRGSPITASVGNTAATAIYAANRQGLKFKPGAGFTLSGVAIRATKAGTPAGMVVSLFEGATLKVQSFVAVNDTISNNTMLIPFATPITLTAGATCYLVVANATGTAGTQGSTSGNNFNLAAYPIASAYVDAMVPTDWRFVSGTGGANPSLDDPTGFTPVDTHYPILFPVLLDPATDLIGSQTVNTTYLAAGIDL